MASALDTRLSPSIGTPTPDGDPFSLSPSGSAGRHRNSSFDTNLLNSHTQTSPGQAKRAIEAHLADTDRRIQDASQLGSTLLDRKVKLEARLREVESGANGTNMAPELSQKLADLEKAYNEVGKETARQFVPKKPRRNSGIGEAITDDSTVSANLRPSPSKPSAGSPRKQRYGPSSHLHDIEFATEISTSLLSQVRALQNTLTEKEDALKRAIADKETIQGDADILALRLRNLDDQEQRVKDENWQLELRNQRLLNEIKEAAAREQRLNHTVNTARAHQSQVEQDYEDMRVNNDKLKDDYEALKQQLDTELMEMHRSLATRESEAASLQRRIDQLGAHNDDLLKAAAYRNRLDQEEADAAAMAGKGLDELEPSTPEPSPPASPVKATPRHGVLESETLKSSLHHAHKMIQNLKNNIHREKTEKIELKRMLQDARDELEARRADVGGSTTVMGKKRLVGNQATFKKPARIDRLGGSKTATDEIINDPAWEEFDDSPLKPHLLDRRDLYDLTTDNSDAFETANEDEAGTTETEGFQTGLESIPGDSEEDLTETEYSNTDQARNSALARLTGAGRVRSFQSTASDDADFFNPFSTSSRRARFRLRLNRCVPPKESDNSNVHGSPASQTTVSGRTKDAYDLAAELEELGGEDSSVAASTPVKTIESMTATPQTFVRDVTPIPFAPAETFLLPRAEVFNKGTMTEPWEPQVRPSALLSSAVEETSPMSSVLRVISTTAEPALAGLASLPPMTNEGDMSPMIPRPLKPSRSLSQARSDFVSNIAKAVPLDMSAIVTQSIEPMGSEVETERHESKLFQFVPPTVLAATEPSAAAVFPIPDALVSQVPAEKMSRPVATDGSAMTESNETPAAVSDSARWTHLEANVTPAAAALPHAFSIPSQTLLENPIVTQLSRSQTTSLNHLGASSMTFMDILMKQSPSHGVDQFGTQTPMTHETPAVNQDQKQEFCPLNVVQNRVIVATEPQRGSQRLELTMHMPQISSQSSTLKTNDEMEESSHNPVQAKPRQVSNSEMDSENTFQVFQSDKEEGNLQEPTLQIESAYQENYRAPFRVVSGNAPAVDRKMFREISESTMEQQIVRNPDAKHNTMSFNQPENTMPDSPKRETSPNPILSIGPGSLSRAGRADSLNARFSTEPVHYIEPAESRASERAVSIGDSSTSPRSSAVTRLPTPPTDHLEATNSVPRVPNGTATMGPPHMPPSSWRGSSQGRPRTPNNVTQAGTVMPTPMPLLRVGPYGRSDVGNRSSISSFGSDNDDRMQDPAQGNRSGRHLEDKSAQNTDPHMIQAITQTMIGEFLYKYTRKTGRDEHSTKRHRRFFWIHPYTRTLYWSNSDPSHAGKSELKAKSVAIEAVRIVNDDNHQPPGLHARSIIVLTPGRSIKFTAPTAQRHETWFNALSYLVLRNQVPNPHSTVTMLDRQQRNASSGQMTNSVSSRPTHHRSDTQSSINSDDVEEFNVGVRPRSTKVPRQVKSATEKGTLSTSSGTHESQMSTNASRFTNAGSMFDRITNVSAETKSSARSTSPTTGHPHSQSLMELASAAAPAPNVPYVPLVNAKGVALDAKAQSSTSSADGFKKPHIPPPRANPEGTSKRGRVGSLTERLSFFGRGRSVSRSREAHADIGTAYALRRDASATSARTAKTADGHGRRCGHHRGHDEADGSGLENVRACCDGKHDVSSLSHRSQSGHRHSSRSRSRTGAGHAGDATSWRSRYSDSGSVPASYGTRVPVPTLTKDAR